MHQHGEGERGERLQCYRTVERGIAESQDGGKGEREAQKAKESERQEWNEKLEEKKDGTKERVGARATWCVRGVGGDCPTKPYGQNYHTHTHVRT